MYLELERDCIQLFNIILYFLAFAKIEKKLYSTENNKIAILVHVGYCVSLYPVVQGNFQCTLGFHS